MASRRREAEKEKKEEAESTEEEEEDLEAAVKEASSSSSASRTAASRPHRQLVAPVPEAVDDLLRNFLRRAGLRRTLGRFEEEWYGSGRRRRTAADARGHTQLLLGELRAVRRETEELREEVLAAGQRLLRTRRESDFHWLQRRRTAEDKARLAEDLKRLRVHAESYEPALRQLQDGHRAALRQRALLSLQRERAHSTANSGQKKKKGSSSQSLDEASDRGTGST